MTKGINVALVGCGRIIPAHLWGYKELEEKNIVDVRIKVLVARKVSDALRFGRRGEGPPPRSPIGGPGDPLRAPHVWVEDFQKDVEVEVYDDYRRMLENADIAAVDVYSSVFSHHSIALDSIAAGKHVMLEKPMAVTVNACKKIVDAARANNVRLAVAEVVRFDVGTRVAKWAIENGYIGEPQMIVQNNVFARKPLVSSSPTTSKASTEVHWRQSKLLGGGGVFFDMGVHHFDAIRYLCGEVEEVSGLIRTMGQTENAADHPIVDDTYFCHFKLEKGAIGIISFSTAGHGESSSIDGGRVIYGSKGCLKGDMIITDNGERMLFSDILKHEIPDSMKEKYFPGGITEWFALETLDWLRSIKEERDPEVSGVEGCCGNNGRSGIEPTQAYSKG